MSELASESNNTAIPFDAELAEHRVLISAPGARWAIVPLTMEVTR